MQGWVVVDLKSLLAHPLKKRSAHPHPPRPGLEFRLCMHEMALQQSPRFPRALLRGTEAPQGGLLGTWEGVSPPPLLVDYY